ncbi:hypothetical protein Scep_015209 [Stephania cephalantha]|uniref:FAF domain-containing protein n=1 Tax=Stephania cephalantha TaxID=152367 RepID=A0AAP0J4P6_9MAGN
MASCGGLQQIFEKRALPEKPTLIESLSWNQIKSINDPSPSFTDEIFGELHFKEIQHHPPSSPSSTPTKTEKAESLMGGGSSSSSRTTHAHHHQQQQQQQQQQQHLQLCTEGLGFESFDDVEEINGREDDRSSTSSSSTSSTTSIVNHNRSYKYRRQFERSRSMNSNGSSSVIKTFPPPISCIGRSGKPWICFKSYRHDGRFVLKEVRIPTREFLHACREDGRLRLHLVQPDGQQQPPRDQQIDDDNDNDQDQDDDEGDEGEEVDDEKIDQSSSIDEANS